MTIQQCRYALEIAKRGSFNEAAKHLFVAQSSLSSSMKALEEELGITVFERVSNGVLLTEDGSEFIRYATQLVEQHDFVLKRYSNQQSFEKLYISTQHYDFVADIFGKLLRETEAEAYRFALRETQTYEVIREIETAYSDIGVLAIKGNDDGIMKRYLHTKGLLFTPFVKAYPHVFVRKGHPLATEKSLRNHQLKDYAYVSYEQGEHHNSFFTEEMMEGYSEKHIEISDRASLMNVLLSTDCYTIGTGIMPSALNNGNIVSVALESEAYYTIGYILPKEREISGLLARFIELLVDLGRNIEQA